MTLRGVRFLLASSSPRRRELLEADGAIVRVVAPAIDDSGADFGGGDPERLASSLAWFKAAQVMTAAEWRSKDARSDWLLSADTICATDGRVFGKPVSEDDARAMIESMCGRTHQVFTGICLLERPDDRRHLFVDRASVTIGRLDDGLLQAHLRGGNWRGRAGGYNFAEVRSAGWPIDCDGDETTVMGLPMARLRRMFASRTAAERGTA